MIIINGCNPEHYQIKTESVTSELVQGYPDLPPNTRNVYVIVPPGYDDADNEDKYYPSIYLLHGAGTGRSNIEKIAKSVKNSLDFMQDQIGEMIVVVPHAGSHLCGKPDDFECSSFFTNSEVNGNFRDYIVQDLVHHIDANYRTINETSKRGLTGFSMGGYGAIMLAMKSATEMGEECPFSSVACHSGILSFEDAKDDFTELLLEPNPSIGQSLMIWYMYNVMLPAVERAFCPNQTLHVRVEGGELKYDEDVFQDILENFDPIDYLSDHSNSLQNYKTYIDCGKYDELGFLKHAQNFRQKLLDLGYIEDNHFKYDEWESGEEWGFDLPDWFSGHSLIVLRAGESLRFHWEWFETSK